ncbi:hypothetical protein KM043_014658 [Ampulex compressa]|nr:hypothetical protein KM043_014658 [Ampulex compressa]
MREGLTRSVGVYAEATRERRSRAAVAASTPFVLWLRRKAGQAIGRGRPGRWWRGTPGRSRASQYRSDRHDARFVPSTGRKFEMFPATCTLVSPSEMPEFGGAR